MFQSTYGPLAAEWKPGAGQNHTRDTDVKNRLLIYVGEGKGGII